MAKIRYVFNPFTAQFDAVEPAQSNKVCIPGLSVGDQLEWTLPDGSKIYSENLVGDTGTVIINSTPVVYAQKIGTNELCVPFPVIATQAPKLIVTFASDELTNAGSFVKVNAINSVTAITSNSFEEIPNGIFGVCFSKPTSILAQVMYIGVISGYSGLTVGAPVFVDTNGLPTQTVPLSGIVQQVGFSVSATEIFIYPQQPMRRS